MSRWKEVTRTRRVEKGSKEVENTCFPVVRKLYYIILRASSVQARKFNKKTMRGANMFVLCGMRMECVFQYT